MKDYKKELEQVKAILSIYQEYTDQIQFTDEDIKKLDSKELNEIF